MTGKNNIKAVKQGKREGKKKDGLGVAPNFFISQFWGRAFFFHHCFFACQKMLKIKVAENGPDNHGENSAVNAQTKINEDYSQKKFDGRIGGAANS